MLALRLPLLDPQLFKKHVAAVEYTTRVSGVGTLLGTEIRELLSLDIDGLRLELRGDIFQETRLRDVVLLKVGGDLFADLIAAIVTLAD